MNAFRQLARATLALATTYAVVIALLVVFDHVLGGRLWLEDLNHGSRRQLAIQTLAWIVAMAWTIVPLALLALYVTRRHGSMRLMLASAGAGVVGMLALVAWLMRSPTPLEPTPGRADRDRLSVLIGGGPVPSHSQISIEENALWIDRLLSGWDFKESSVLFTAGPSGPADVVADRPDDPRVRRWLPIARVYGEQKSALAVYQRNRLGPNVAPATRESVEAAIRQVAKRVGPGDALFIVFSGHGSHESGDPSRNALRLWGESRLDVRDFQSLVSGIDEGATARFVLPQCYSGGFARAIFKNPARPSVEAVSGNLCGFVSVAPHNESEGCTPGVDVGQYRDYSTYFFAALAGQTREGKALDREPDADGDGRVSLAEAHGYAFSEGESTDVPFRTSEYFLEVWQPPTSRWLSALSLPPEGVYVQLAARLAKKLSLSGEEPSAWARQASTHRMKLGRSLSRAEQELASWEEEERTVREPLRMRFEREWPRAAKAHGASYEAFAANEVDSAVQWLSTQPEYGTLEQLQQRIERRHQEILDLQRQSALFARVQRAIRMAAIERQFLRRAEPEERAAYQALVACEDWTPGVAVSR